MMTAAAYVLQIAEPTLEDFRHHRADLRRGMLASMAVLHVVDFVMQNRKSTPEQGDKAVKKFKGRMAKSLASFDVVNKFALASKHAALTQHPGFDTDRHRIQSLGGPLSAFGLLGSPTDILVTLDDGSTVVLMHALDTTMALYRTEFPEAFPPP